MCINEQISYLIQFTGQLLVFFREQDSIPLILLLVLGLKLFPFALAGGSTNTWIVKLVTLYKLTFILTIIYNWKSSLDFFIFT